ncbi:MAG: zinc ribbon domain-containing protein [Nitrososphaerota archaeon]
MTPLMMLGMILSILGVAMIFGLIVYYVSLPLDNPIRVFLDMADMGLPYLLYFVIIGAILSAVGLLLYIRGVKTGIMVTAGTSYTSSRITTRTPPLSKPVTTPPKKMVKKIEKTPSVVEEIEKEIEEILEVEEKPPTPPPVEEKKPAIEIVSKASDMVCPHCGKLNPLGSRKCKACGQQMFTPEEPSMSCPVCNAPLSLSQNIAGDLYVCGICFSELKIPPEIQKTLNLK